MEKKCQVLITNSMTKHLRVDFIESFTWTPVSTSCTTFSHDSSNFKLSTAMDEEGNHHHKNPTFHSNASFLSFFSKRRLRYMYDKAKEKSTTPWLQNIGCVCEKKTLITGSIMPGRHFQRSHPYWIATPRYGLDRLHAQLDRPELKKVIITAFL